VSAFYLYGIARPRELPQRFADEGIVALAQGDRAAIALAVEPRAVEASRRNLLAHADVVETLHGDGVVLPARFGTVLEDREAVNALLGLPEVEELLVRHERTSELRLKGAYDESVLATLPLGPAKDAYRREPTLDNGIALGEAVTAALAERRARDAERVLGRLAPLTTDVRASDVVGELDAFAFALLVARSAVDAASAALDELAAELSPPLRFTLVGPLPPYSFVDLRLPALA
jgi:hypothetical protein